MPRQPQAAQAEAEGGVSCCNVVPGLVLGIHDPLNTHESRGNSLGFSVSTCAFGHDHPNDKKRR
jgi:hypothetical protein